MSASLYFDTRSVSQVLAGLIKNPNLLLRTDKYNFNQEDFGSSFHLYIYGAIANLKGGGAKTITPLDIDNYLSNRPNIYEIYNKSKGPEYLTDITKAADESNFDYYYDRMKKMTLLRVYSNSGMDVKFLYNPSELDIKKKQLQEDWLDTTDLVAIADAIDDKINKIRTEYLINAEGKGAKAGENIFELIQRLKETPEVGVPLYGNLINTITRGARLKKFYLRSAATGLGKALVNGTLITTPDGFIPIEEMKVGQPIFGEDGKVYRVEGVFPQGKKKVYKITFSNGVVVEACGEHLWTYRNNVSDQEFLTQTTAQILEKYKNRFPKVTNFTKANIPILPEIRPLRYGRKDLPIKPYTMGVLNMAGSFDEKTAKRARVLFKDTSVMKRVNDELKYTNATLSENVHSKGRYISYVSQLDREGISRIRVALEELGCFQRARDYRFIPKIYKESSPKDRWDYVKGMMDAKGNYDITTNGYRYQSSTLEFAEDIKEICDSLGLPTRIIASKSSKIDEHGNKVMYEDGHYDVMIKTNSFIQKIHEVERHEERWKKPSVFPYVYMMKIEELDEEKEMTCISTTNPTELFIIKGGIVTHNTRMSIADAAYIASDEFYSSSEKKWVPNGTKEPALFISTEQEIEELQTMLLAFLSEVNEENILNGSYTDDQEERVIKAAQILKEIPLYLEELPDFSLSDIENIIRKHVVDNGVKYIFMDYIHTSLKILEEITKKTGGMRLREDNILFMLAIRLKDLCNQYGVFIMSATQLNGVFFAIIHPFLLTGRG